MVSDESGGRRLRQRKAPRTPTRASSRQAGLAALTPEAKGALGGAELPVTQFPFRVGLDSRGRAGRGPIVMDRRRRGPDRTMICIGPSPSRRRT
jgi:hypothetical protein